MLRVSAVNLPSIYALRDNPLLKFTLEKESSESQARAGILHVQHGDIQTPVFMPVATQATVKGQTVESLKQTGTQILLANTYHLLLRPGREVFEKFGGIHRFMNWDGPVLTDSGGYQIFSLPHARAMSEAGASFQSYVDGKTQLLSPESSIAMQQAIGSDIMMVLDQCIPSTAPRAQAQAAMELTHRWAERSLKARSNPGQALFGIIQGGCHTDLRKQSAAYLRQLPFDGLAIGGLAVGETPSKCYEITELVTDDLPKQRPRYLMGVGTPIDLLECVHRGVDMFDCIIPSQLAQRGVVFTSQGKLQMRRTVYRLSEQALDRDCDCAACRHFSRAYLHHLIKTDEVLGWHLLGQHNLTFYHRLMRDMRASILRGEFAAFYRTKRPALLRTDIELPTRAPRKNPDARTPSLGDYEVYKSPHGFFSIKQKSSGEVMHSVSPPSEEANKLYVEQSALAQRLTDPGREEPELIIWDVGLGAATNAMAVLRCFGNLAQIARPLRLISFERDLDPLKLALKHSGNFPHLWHPAPAAILAHGRWEQAAGLFCWELMTGDFSAVMASASAPDLIFYDPFSYKTNVALWSVELFNKIFAHCSGKSTELYTYSASTAVRASLLAAGFFITQGVGTGPKVETTIAFNRAHGVIAHPLQPALLGQEWLQRWRRSSARFPVAISAAEHRDFAARIENHPQFQPG